MAVPFHVPGTGVTAWKWEAQWESFEKIGPPFQMDHFSPMDWSDQNAWQLHFTTFQTILNPSTLLFSICHAQHGGKLLSLKLLPGDLVT